MGTVLSRGGRCDSEMAFKMRVGTLAWVGVGSAGGHSVRRGWGGVGASADLSLQLWLSVSPPPPAPGSGQLCGSSFNSCFSPNASLLGRLY